MPGLNCYDYVHNSYYYFNSLETTIDPSLTFPIYKGRTPNGSLDAKHNFFCKSIKTNAKTPSNY